MIAFLLLLACICAYAVTYLVYQLRRRRFLPAAGTLLLVLLPVACGLLLLYSA